MSVLPSSFTVLSPTNDSPFLPPHAVRYTLPAPNVKKPRAARRPGPTSRAVWFIEPHRMEAMFALAPRFEADKQPPELNPFDQTRVITVAELQAKQLAADSYLK